MVASPAVTGRGLPRQSGPTAWGRAGHPSRCLTVVHDGDRLDAVTLWLAGPRAAHLGDQVGWPRGGLAPSGTYVIRLDGGGYLSVVGGTLVAWESRPGAGPVLTPFGELDDLPAPLAPNVVPLHRPAPAVGGPLPANCPFHHLGGLRLAGDQDAVRERERRRREQSEREAVDAARDLLATSLLPDRDPDLDALTAGIRTVLGGATAIGPFAQRVSAGVPGPVMAALLRRLARRPTGEGSAPVDVPNCPASDFQIAYRVMAQRALAMHGDAVLDALPARMVADGMVADALLRPRLERLLGWPLPGDLGLMARWSLHGLDEPLGEVDPEPLRIALMAMGLLG